MKYILDTHTLIWFLDGSKELSDNARIIIENPDNIKYISIASIWEIAIKIKLGKLKYIGSLNTLRKLILQNAFEIMPINYEHIMYLEGLELIHRDPFDRILIAQTLYEKAIILTRDENIKKYDVKTKW